MASTPSFNSDQKAAGLSAPPGKRQPIPTIARGSRSANVKFSLGEGVGEGDDFIDKVSRCLWGSVWESQAVSYSVGLLWCFGSQFYDEKENVLNYALNLPA